VLEGMLEQIENNWRTCNFEVVSYNPERLKDVYVLGSVDDIVAMLDESQVTISTILGSRYYLSWAHTCTKMVCVAAAILPLPICVDTSILSVQKCRSGRGCFFFSKRHWRSGQLVKELGCTWRIYFLLQTWCDSCPRKRSFSRVWTVSGGGSLCCGRMKNLMQ
jgi:hypothetical protein